MPYRSEKEEPPTSWFVCVGLIIVMWALVFMMAKSVKQENQAVETQPEQITQPDKPIAQPAKPYVPSLADAPWLYVPNN